MNREYAKPATLPIWLLFFWAFVFSAAPSVLMASPEQDQETDFDTERAFSKRFAEEKTAADMKYTFSSHKPSYILPVTYNSTPSKQNVNNLSKVDYVEVKFQYSFKLHIIESFWNDHFQWSFAYTNLSFWQLYNKSNSRPFRETNHEPDLFLVYRPNGAIKANLETFYRFGLVHESNGQNAPESRSWNRIYAQGVFNVRALVAALKVWYRLPEDPKVNPTDSDGDDNPNILEYMGFFELQLMKKLGDHTLTALLRNNGREDNRGAIEVKWSFPLNENYRGVVQYFNGYGESLIDYNQPASRIGAGVLIADWL